MKKFCLLLCLIYSISFNSTAQTLSIGWELWYPYQYHNKQQQLVGLDFDILNAVLKEAKLKANYTELPWKRHLHYIKTGDMDIAMGSSFSKERESFAYFSIPYRQEIVKLYVKKGTTSKIKLNTLADLIKSPYMIGVEGGYYYGSQYQQLILDPNFQSHISEVVDLEENANMLLKGHIDGFLVDPFTMKAFVDKYKLYGEFEMHPITIYQADIHLMISKASGSKALVEKLNQAISALKKRNDIDAIFDKWGSNNN